MARPIAHDTVRDARAELIARLEAAPTQHAEALLSAYEVLQASHESGLLEVVRGALESRDALLEMGVNAAQEPSAARGVRNLLLLINALGAIEPDALARFTKALPGALEAAAHPSEPPGLLGLLMKFLDKDARQGLVAAQSVLATLGRSLNQPANSKHPRQSASAPRSEKRSP